MRATQTKSGLRLQGIAGTHVVILGWDVTDAQTRKGLLGFALEREDRTEGEKYWLRGMKTFPGSTPLPTGGDASTHNQPLQTFQWGDYTAKPGHSYRYRLVAMYDTPDALREGAEVSISIRTEAEDPQATHNVYFNRGAVASQEYARRFQNRKPSEVGAAAYAWLSRGLKEALLGFLREASDDTYGLRMAIYEFQWPEVLQEIQAASRRKVDVQVVFDAIPNASMSPVTPNRDAIKAAKISGLCKPFTDGKLMHNKFVVLTRNGQPVSVWTGSTNITENGLFGHLNCGHRVNDAAVASQFLDYWNVLRKDPGTAAIKQWTDSHCAKPTCPPTKGVGSQFSPQSGLVTLQQYGSIAALAKKGLFMTFAFGMNPVFQADYRLADAVPRFALMEKEGNGVGLAQGKLDIAEIRKRANVFVAVGKNIPANAFDRWLRERSSVVDQAHVRWIHTKFMLVDPLGNDPMVVTGSANFSDASTNANAENMLLIRGDKRVADIYFTEFMRSFSHYAFREAVANHAEQKNAATPWEPQNLDPSDGWLAGYFQRGSPRSIKRLLFSGQ